MKSLLTFVFVLGATLAWAGVNTSCSPVQAKQPAQAKQSKQVLACVPVLKAQAQKDKAEKVKNNTEVVAPVANEKPLYIEIPEIPIPAEAKPLNKKLKKNTQPSILPLMMCSPALLNRLYTEKPSEG